jgi:hypothetical protein
MSTDPQADPIDGNVRTLQIIHIALAMGVASFLVIAVVVMRRGAFFGKDPWSVTSPLTLVAIVFAAMAIAAHALVPNLVVTARRKELARAKKAETADFEGIVALYTTQKIIGAALLEGAAFFNTIAYFLEGTALPLLFALLLLGILLSRIPSRDGMTMWIEGQLAQLREERHLE